MIIPALLDGRRLDDPGRLGLGGAENAFEPFPKSASDVTFTGVYCRSFVRSQPAGSGETGRCAGRSITDMLDLFDPCCTTWRCKTSGGHVVVAREEPLTKDGHPPSVKLNVEETQRPPRNGTHQGSRCAQPRQSIR